MWKKGRGPAKNAAKAVSGEFCRTAGRLLKVISIRGRCLMPCRRKRCRGGRCAICSRIAANRPFTALATPPLVCVGLIALAAQEILMARAEKTLLCIDDHETAVAG